ncbi:MAG: twin-arginine translocation signal domain-containing protein, partial [Actinoallomurus sp.]
MVAYLRGMEKRTELSRRRLLGLAAAGVGAAVVGAPNRALAARTAET